MRLICISFARSILIIQTVIRGFVMAGFLATIGQLEAAVRYTAPFGPGGTWNVYEYVDTPTTFWMANQVSTQAVHSGVFGHLVAIGSKEEDLAVGRLARGDIWIGLTDQRELGGTETGKNPQVDKWDGWRGDVAEIPFEVRELVQPNGWIWLSGEPYEYQVWDAGEPNNFDPGEGGVRRRGSGFWNDDGIGAFGQSAPTIPYVIEYETHSPFPVSGTIQLDPLFPPNRLAGIEGGPGSAGIEIYNTGRPFDNIEPVIGSLATGDLVNPLFGTAPTINFHDPQSGGGGLFPSGRLTFPGNTAADDNNFQVLIKGAIEVPTGQGGTWTFNIHADDGFAFRINGVEFTTAHGNGYVDFADRSTLTYPGPTGDASTRGVINLLPGVYPFQFVMFELGGGAFCELSAAPGAHPTDASTSKWQLVNSALSPLKFVAAPLPPVITQYTPPPVVVNQGETATWSVDATGPGPLRYQWQKNTGINNWVDIPGATNSTHTIPSVQPGEHDGEYRVIVSNPAGSTATSLRSMAVANKPPVTFAGYVVASPVNFITTTSPEQTINNHAIPFTAQQLESVRLADNTFLAQGVYHLFKIPNTGQMTIRWTGFGTGNHQIYFSYWNGSQFVIRDIRDAAENQSYEIAVNRPLAENFVYTLINCTSGQINTDQLTISGPASETPILVTQPQSITASQGGPATFSVIATGSAPLYYQWRFNGEDIPGATNSSYTITSAQPAQAGNYSVIVGNSAGSVTSSNAALNVDTSSILAVSDPAFSNVDWDLVVYSSTSQSGATASQASDGNGNPDPYMTVTHTLAVPSTVRSIHVRKSAYNPTTQGGIESITYSQDARIIATEAGTIGGSTGPALRQGGKIFVIENGLTSAIRDSLNTALPSPYKVIQHQTLTAGNFVELVGANQFNFAQQPDFTVNGAPIEFGFFVANSHTVSVPTTRIIGADNWSITIKPAPSQPPVITAQPQDLAVPLGGRAVLSVTASGAAPLTYQWQYNGADIPGATGASLTVSSMQLENAGDYTVVVSNAGGSVTSNPARLSLQLPLSGPSLSFTLDGERYEISTESQSPGHFRLMESTDLITWTDSGQRGFVGSRKTWLRTVPSDDSHRFYRLEPFEVQTKGTTIVQLPAPDYFGHQDMK
jgi:hypothetical protein